MTFRESFKDYVEIQKTSVKVLNKTGNRSSVQILAELGPKATCGQGASASLGRWGMPSVGFCLFVLLSRYHLWKISYTSFRAVSPSTDLLLWEAPGPGTVAQTGSRTVSRPQGNPKPAGVWENLLLGGRMLMATMTRS